LQKAATAFKHAHGRFPTLWLDVTCFNQKDLSTSLKALPVNIQACNRVLVLCGPTYCNRLWCVWELYTVFVFAQNNLAAKRVQLEELEGEHVDVPSLLAQFHLQGCHCYDPNEEHKIRSVIKECGEGSFESNIRELGKTISTARTHTKTTL